MPGSRKFTSNLHEISLWICVKTSESCLENSSDFKYCFGLEEEATVERSWPIFAVLAFASRNCSVTPEVEGHSSRGISRVHPPWTLSALCYVGNYRMGILNTQQGEVCMVAPPCWMFIIIFHSIDSHWIIQRVMIFKSWPTPQKLCIVNHQGWSSLLHLFKLRRPFFS